MDKEKLSKIQRCKSCTLPLTLPSVNLNENGICNHCLRYDKILVNWKKNQVEKSKQLKELIERTKKLERPYDCLIPLSGGKDSTYALYYFSKVLKLRCLTVTFDNGFMSEHAKRNIEQSIIATNAGHIRHSVSRNDLLKIYRVSIQKSGQFCSVCMRGIGKSIEIATSSFKIPLIVHGGGATVTYLGMFPEVFQNGNSFFFSNMLRDETIFKEAKCMITSPLDILLTKIQNRLLRSSIIDRYGYKIKIGKRNIYLYDYLEFSSEKIKKTIKREMGWRTPENEFEHMDCQLHEMQHYVNTFKFDELTLNTFHRSHLVRLGEMTRENALRLEEEELMEPKIPEVLNSFLSETQCSHSDFTSQTKDWKKMRRYRSRIS